MGKTLLAYARLRMGLCYQIYIHPSGEFLQIPEEIDFCRQAFFAQILCSIFFKILKSSIAYEFFGEFQIFRRFKPSIFLCFQGKLEDAERLFQAALREAKEGFGERDPHVASACNNLVGPLLNNFI